MRQGGRWVRQGGRWADRSGQRGRGALDDQGRTRVVEAVKGGQVIKRGSKVAKWSREEPVLNPKPQTLNPKH